VHSMLFSGVLEGYSNEFCGFVDDNKDLLSSSSALSTHFLGSTFTVPPTVVAAPSSPHDSDFIDASVDTDAIDTASPVGPFFLFGKIDSLTFDAFRFRTVDHFTKPPLGFFE
jgi:hypothetical protein